MKNLLEMIKTPEILLVPLAVALLSFFIYGRYFSPEFFFFMTFALGFLVVYLLAAYFSMSRRRDSLAFEKEQWEERLNLLETDNARERDTHKALQEKIINFRHLKNLAEKLCGAFSSSDTASIMAAELNSVLGRDASTAIVYYLDGPRGELSLMASLRDGVPLNLKAKRGDLYDSWVVKHSKPLLVEDTKNDFRFDVEKIPAEDGRIVRSLIAAPLTVGDKSVGLLRIDGARTHQFTTEDLRFLDTVGHIGAVAIENAHLFEHVEDLAIKDSLTGLYLRRHLMERFAAEIVRHSRNNEQLAFIMIDLDHFKQYNDRFGHTAGDIVLKTISMILSGLFSKPGDIVCRFGGEEFCVLLPDRTKKKAAQLAEEFREKIEKQTIILRRQKTRVTVSVGVAAFPVDGRTKEELVQKADEALYAAKGGGRNKVVLARETP